MQEAHDLLTTESTNKISALQLALNEDRKALAELREQHLIQGNAWTRLQDVKADLDVKYEDVFKKWNLERTQVAWLQTTLRKTKADQERTLVKLTTVGKLRSEEHAASTKQRQQLSHSLQQQTELAAKTQISLDEVRKTMVDMKRTTSIAVEKAEVAQKECNAAKHAETLLNQEIKQLNMLIQDGELSLQRKSDEFYRKEHEYRTQMETMVRANDQRTKEYEAAVAALEQSLDQNRERLSVERDTTLTLSQELQASREAKRLLEETLTSELKSTTGQLRSMTDKAIRLEKALDETTSARDASIAEGVNLRKELSTTRNNYDIAFAKATQLEKLSKVTAIHLAEHKEEIKKLRPLETINEAHLKELEELREAHFKLEKDHKPCKGSITSMKRRIGELEDRVKGFGKPKQALKEATEKIHKLQLELRNVERERDMLEKIEEKYDMVVAEHTKCKSVDDQLSDLERRMQMQQEQYDALTRTHNTCGHDIARLFREKDAIEIEHKSCAKVLEDRDALQQQLELLQRSATVYEHMMMKKSQKEMSEQLENLKTEYQKQANELKENNAALEEAREDLVEAHGEISNMHQTYVPLKKETQRLTEEVEENRKDIANLSSLLLDERHEQLCRDVQVEKALELYQSLGPTLGITVHTDKHKGGQVCVISEVKPESPGVEAGLKVKDHIQEVNGVAVKNKDAYVRQMMQYLPGETIVLRIFSKDASQQKYNCVIELGGMLNGKMLNVKAVEHLRRVSKMSAKIWKSPILKLSPADMPSRNSLLDPLLKAEECEKADSNSNE